MAVKFKKRMNYEQCIAELDVAFLCIYELMLEKGLISKEEFEEKIEEKKKQFTKK